MAEAALSTVPCETSSFPVSPVMTCIFLGLRFQHFSGEKAIGEEKDTTYHNEKIDNNNLLPCSGGGRSLPSPHVADVPAKHLAYISYPRGHKGRPPTM